MRKIFSIFLVFVALVCADEIPRNIARVLDDWDRQDIATFNASMAEIDAYFDSVKENIDPFCDDAYSLKSKFYAIWGSEHIEKLFRAHLLNEDILQRELRRIVDDFVMDIQANRNRKLLEIEASLRKIGKVHPRISLRFVFQDRISTSSKNTGNNAVCSELVSLVLGEIAATIAINALALETSATLTAVANFGLAVIVAVSVDLAVNAIAKNRTEKKIAEEIDRMNAKVKAVLRPALFQALRKYCANKRKEVSRCCDL